MEIQLRNSNTFFFDDMQDIEQLIFKQVYQNMDGMLYEIVYQQLKHENQQNKIPSLNTISIIGGRGRGKTSAMLSFLFDLNNLQSKRQWSRFQDDKTDLDFIILPYIDAAMLSNDEFIVDIVLAKMWDKFETACIDKKKDVHHKEKDKVWERDLKKKFVDIRKYYLELKNIEKGRIRKDDELLPTPSELHDLALSVNLRDEMKELIESFLNYSTGKKDSFLIVPIDDIDMSFERAYNILEQIRRFLNLPQVIVFLTTDIQRLEMVCTHKFKELFTDESSCVRYVEEYLEKVLPNDKRIYMPEIQNMYQDVKINISTMEQTKAYKNGQHEKNESMSEKDLILKKMAEHYHLYFDGRIGRARHFLQNKSLRSMTYYFEKLYHSVGQKYPEENEAELRSFLMADLQERLMERIKAPVQKRFMQSLLVTEYEDLNIRVLEFVRKNLTDGSRRFSQGDDSLGQVLYACSLLEQESIDNRELIQCILMLYTIILSDKDLAQEIKIELQGKGILGERNYQLFSKSGAKANRKATGLAAKCILTWEIGQFLEMKEDDISIKQGGKNPTYEFVEKVIQKYADDIIALAFALCFFEIELDTVDFSYKRQESETQDVKQSFKTDENQRDTSVDEFLLSIKADFQATKAYMSGLYLNNDVYRNQIDTIFIKILEALESWAKEHGGENLERKDELKSMLYNKYEFLYPTLNDVEHIPIEYVEIYYCIVQCINRAEIDQADDGRSLLEQLRLQYQFVKEKLNSIDAYYERLNCSKGFGKNYGNSFLACLLLGEMPEPLNEKFQNLMKEFLAEVSDLTRVTWEDIF